MLHIQKSSFVSCVHVFLVRSREQNRCRRRCSTATLFPSPPPDANDDDDALLLLRLLISLQFSSSSSGKKTTAAMRFSGRAAAGDARRRRRRRRRRPPPLRKVFSPSSLHRVVANAWGCRHASSPDAKRPRRRRHRVRGRRRRRRGRLLFIHHPGRREGDGDASGESGRDLSRRTRRKRGFIDGGWRHRSVLVKTRRRRHRKRRDFLFDGVPREGILRAERVMLNFMQRMSGIATLTKKDERTSETGENFRDEENSTGFTGHR